MPFDRSIIDIIERAHDARRYCHACGAPSVVHTHGDQVWIECADLENHRGRLSQLLYTLGAHDRILVADLAA